MKGYEWIGVLGTMFLGLTTINHILGGTWINTTDVSILNQMRITQNVAVGFISIPIPGLGYFQGVMALLKGDYSLFAGNAQFIYFLFQTITFMIGFAMLILILSIAVNAIRGR